MAEVAGGDTAPNDIVEFLTHLEKERDVSPNTVKTHVGKLFEKLGARRRTAAIRRARELGILG